MWLTGFIQVGRPIPFWLTLALKMSPYFWFSFELTSKINHSKVSIKAIPLSVQILFILKWTIENHTELTRLIFLSPQVFPTVFCQSHTAASHRPPGFILLLFKVAICLNCTKDRKYSFSIPKTFKRQSLLKSDITVFCVSWYLKYTEMLHLETHYVLWIKVVIWSNLITFIQAF